MARGDNFYGAVNFSNQDLYCAISKLKIKGISSSFVNIMSIYDNIEFCVRLGDKGKRTGMINQKKGLRQGCNMRPHLFLIFINEILEGNQLIETHCPTIDNIKIPGLIFADDLCLISISQIGLQRKINLVCKFCKTWDLKINTKKKSS